MLVTPDMWDPRKDILLQVGESTPGPQGRDKDEASFCTTAVYSVPNPIPKQHQEYTSSPSP